MEESNNGKTPRKRSLTELTLSWIAERLRKKEEIREKLENGTLEVQSDKIARAILSDE